MIRVFFSLGCDFPCGGSVFSKFTIKKLKELHGIFFDE